MPFAMKGHAYAAYIAYIRLPISFYLLKGVYVLYYYTTYTVVHELSSQNSFLVVFKSHVLNTIIIRIQYYTFSKPYL